MASGLNLRQSGWRFASRLIFAAIFIAFMNVSFMSQSLAAQQAPADFDQVSQSAASARDANDIPHAIDLYKQGVQLNPAWAEGWWYLGVLQYGANDFAAARDALSHLIELSPQSGPAIALRGLCEFETAEYPQSMNDIRQGMKMGAASNPHNGSILRYHEALLLAHFGDPESALIRYAFFAHGPPPDPEVVMAAGMAGLRISLLPKDVGADAPERELYNAAGKAALTFMSGNKAGARQQFQDLFARFPTAANAHYLYGYLLFGEDPANAIPEFTRELEVQPANSAAETMLGWSYLMQEDYPRARDHGAKAVEEAPQLAAAQLVLGRSLVETGDLKAGLEHLEKALSMQPDNIEIHLALVRAYSKAGRKEEARLERLKCLELNDHAETAVAQP